MTKGEFIASLRKKLSGLPHAELEERIVFYSEMIDDRIEEGCSEEDAIADIGSLDEISAQITREVPLKRLINERIRPKRRLSVTEIVLLAIGSPIWLSLAIAVFAVALSLYAVLWSLVISLWAVFVSFAACGVGGILGGVILAFTGNALSGLALIGAALVCAGLSIPLFFGCRAATYGSVMITKGIVPGIKKCFVRKEEI